MRTDIFPETRYFSFSRMFGKAHAIFPIFLPFSGCPHRCLFCAQDVQTGQKSAPVRRHLDEAGARLKERHENSLPALELAFFGGTFTALHAADLRDCLDFAMYWREKGALRSFRCSTRPDCLDAALLEQLAEAGCTLVELGVQSFSDAALAASERGYTGRQAKEGCALVKESGLALGIQLMPGMPGLDAEEARRDIDTAISLQPDCARLYPCLVLEGSGLAPLWRAGKYTPWSLGECVRFLARACLCFQEAGIPVIRMGVAEEPGLDEHVLAGPRHPALGNMVRSSVLYLYLRDKFQEFKTEFPEIRPRLFAPRRFQGEFWGHKKELAASYAAMGLTRENVIWWEREHFALGPVHK